MTKATTTKATTTKATKATTHSHSHSLSYSPSISRAWASRSSASPSFLSPSQLHIKVVNHLTLSSARDSVRAQADSLSRGSYCTPCTMPENPFDILLQSYNAARSTLRYMLTTGTAAATNNISRDASNHARRVGAIDLGATKAAFVARKQAQASGGYKMAAALYNGLWQAYRTLRYDLPAVLTPSADCIMVAVPAITRAVKQGGHAFSLLGATAKGKAITPYRLAMRDVRAHINAQRAGVTSPTAYMVQDGQGGERECDVTAYIAISRYAKAIVHNESDALLYDALVGHIRASGAFVSIRVRLLRLLTSGYSPRKATAVLMAGGAMSQATAYRHLDAVRGLTAQFLQVRNG